VRAGAKASTTPYGAIGQPGASAANRVDAKTIRAFRRRVLRWGEHNGGAYPWRKSRSLYRILVSEFMLHRTQASQVVPVYRAFVAEYPNLDVSVQADIRRQRRLLGPLGLYWRSEGMLKALRALWIDHRGVPADYDRLLAVEGIGPYIAGAIVCFSKNVPVALVDANTVRVVGRTMGLMLQGEARRRKEMRETIGDLCDPSRPREYYYAMIDLAHNVCRPRQPECRICPLLSLPCQYGQKVMAPQRRRAEAK